MSSISKKKASLFSRRTLSYNLKKQLSETFSHTLIQGVFAIEVCVFNTIIKKFNNRKI